MNKFWVLILCIYLLLPVSIAKAHYDPPGPPPIEVKAKLEEVRLLTDMDDGIDGNAELLLTVVLTHRSHGTTPQQFYTDALNYDVTSIWNYFDGSTTLWRHFECTPREDVIVNAELVEIDTDFTQDILVGIASAVGSYAVTCAIVGSVVPGGGTLVGAVVGGVTGLVIGIAGALNGNDNLGANNEWLPGNGPITVGLQGEDGRAQVKFIGETNRIEDRGQCVEPEEARLPPPEIRTEAVFAPLRQALSLVSDVNMEHGNPADLTEEQLNDIQRTLVGATTGIAELLTGAEIESARELEGVDEAIQFFLRAQEELRDHPQNALELYGRAFYETAIVHVEGEPSSEPILLPFQISLTPSFMSTKENRTPILVAAVFGSTGPVKLTVLEHPPDILPEVVQLDPQFPIFQIKLPLADVSPGIYHFVVGAIDGIQEAIEEFTVVVNS